MRSSKKTWGLGYSCVLFAWMSFCAFANPRESMQLFGLRIPSVVVTIPYTSLEWECRVRVTPRARISLYPFAVLLLTKLLIPNSSFLGHLCGLLVG